MDLRHKAGCGSPCLLSGTACCCCNSSRNRHWRLLKQQRRLLTFTDDGSFWMKSAFDVRAPIVAVSSPSSSPNYFPALKLTILGKTECRRSPVRKSLCPGPFGKQPLWQKLILTNNKREDALHLLRPRKLMDTSGVNKPRMRSSILQQDGLMRQPLLALGRPISMCKHVLQFFFVAT